MLNQQAVAEREREQFYADHDPHVITSDGLVLFVDGATTTTGLGRLVLPPDDKWERAKLVAQYWSIVAEQATQQFEAFKDYLNGSGQRQQAWVALYTEEDRLEHLRHLRTQAKRFRAKLAKAKMKLNESKPFWIEEREQAEIEEQARKHEFLQNVENITL